MKYYMPVSFVRMGWLAKAQPFTFALMSIHSEQEVYLILVIVEALDFKQGGSLDGRSPLEGCV